MENIIQLIKRHFIYDRKGLLTSSITITLVMFVLSFLEILSNDNDNEVFVIFYIIMFITGFIASGQFSFIHNQAQSHLYHLLPASRFEKFVAHYLARSIIFAIVALTWYSIGALSGATLGAMVFDRPYETVRLFSDNILKVFGIFLVLQPVYFCGGLFFKSNAFMKTTFAIFLFAVVMGIFNALLFWAVFGELRFNFDSYYFNNLQQLEALQHLAESILPLVSKILFWGILGPFFLVVSYFKFAESEV